MSMTLSVLFVLGYRRAYHINLLFQVSYFVLPAVSPVHSAAVLGRHILPTELKTISNTTAVGLTDNATTSSSMVNMTSTNNNAVTAQGWTSSPNGRGTIDIIWSCALTIFLCSWTVLCLNIPPPDWSLLKYTNQKNLIACEGILGPEFVFQTALGQWVSACCSVKDFTNSGYPQWTMAHAFLADMGGYVLHPTDFVRFPLNAKQVHYLVKEGYIDYSTVGVSKSTIDDKNKGDGMARFITVLQILWFVVNMIARAIQRVTITTLELTTLGYIVCTLGTYFFWAHKPLDIKEPIVLVPSITMADILTKAGAPAAKPYKHTPMDFVGQEHSSWFLYWTYWFNILRKMGINFHTLKRPIDKIPDDQFAPLDARTTPILFLFQTGYAAVHIAGWNFHFPTKLERRLWRIATTYIIIAIVIYWIADMYAWHLLPAVKKFWAASRFAKQITEPEAGENNKHSKETSKFREFAARLRNNSADNDPNMDVPLKALIPVTTVAAIYCIARLYIVTEDFVALRALPQSAYASVNWSAFLPHL